MIRQIFLHKFVESELERFKELHERLIKKLKVSPEGSLSYHNGEVCRTGRYQGRKYQIPLRGDEVLHRALKDKRQIKACLPVVRSRMKVLETFLENDVLYDPESICSKLVSQYHIIEGDLIRLREDINVEEWAKAPYIRNPYPFAEDHFTRSGLRARSKSEAMIGTELEERNQIFRIEPQLKLKDKIVYPDFAIVLPHSRRIIYWEHLGRIDLENYVADNLGKFIDYAKKGIFIGINLIITYETKAKPLNLLVINETIDMILAMDLEK